MVSKFIEYSLEDSYAIIYTKQEPFVNWENDGRDDTSVLKLITTTIRRST